MVLNNGKTENSLLYKTRIYFRFEQNAFVASLAKLQLEVSDRCSQALDLPSGEREFCERRDS